MTVTKAYGQVARQTCHLGPQSVAWYIQPYHGVKVSCADTYRTQRRQGLSQLPKKSGLRAVHTHRCAKHVPGPLVKADIKFLMFKNPAGKPVK